MFHDNLTKNLFKAKNLTQKFITSYEIDPKIYFLAEKYPQKTAHPLSQYMGVTPREAVAERK